MYGSFDHDLFHDQLRQMGKYFEDLGQNEFTLNQIAIPWFPDLTKGDLIKLYDINGGNEVIGIVSNIRVGAGTRSEFVHVWIELLVGQEDFVFHCRLNRHDFNDAILYTDVLAMHIDKIEVIQSMNFN